MPRPDRKKPWPFQGNSLFTFDPALDEDDREVFGHVLDKIRADFKVGEDDKDPRYQVLLDEVVDLYSRLANAKANVALNQRDNVIDNLRDKVRKSLMSLMQFTNAKKIEKKLTLESRLRGEQDDIG
jgi:hypothetical protein